MGSNKQLAVLFSLCIVVVAAILGVRYMQYRSAVNDGVAWQFSPANVPAVAIGVNADVPVFIYGCNGKQIFDIAANHRDQLIRPICVYDGFSIANGPVVHIASQQVAAYADWRKHTRFYDCGKFQLTADDKTPAKSLVGCHQVPFDYTFLHSQPH